VSRRANPVAIGAFVVGAVALAVIGLVLLGSFHLFDQPVKVVMFFDESVAGLSVGAPVAFRGVKLGEVTAIRTRVGTTRIAVFADLERRPFMERGGAETGPLIAGGVSAEAFLRDAIQQTGLRAQLALQSLVTGQLVVSLVLRPDTPIAETRLERARLEIPTIPTFREQVNEALQKVPWDKVLTSVQETLERVNTLVKSPEIPRALAALEAALGDTQKLVAQLERELATVVASVRETSDTTRATVSGAGRDLQQTLAHLDGLIASLRQTSDEGRGAIQTIVAEMKTLRGQTSALLETATQTSDATRGAVTDVAADLRQTLAQVQRQVDTVGTELSATAEALRAAANRGEAALAGAEGVLTGEAGLGPQLQRTLRQLGEAARALQSLADYLERHPEALLSGKDRPGGPR
jgi:paraquat-inducible protein B